MRFAVHVSAPHTGAGHPQRGWAAYADGQLFAFAPEGWESRAQTLTRLQVSRGTDIQPVNEHDTVEVAAREYLRLSRTAEARDGLVL